MLVANTAPINLHQVNDTELEGSVLALPRTSLLWAPKRFEVAELVSQGSLLVAMHRQRLLLYIEPCPKGLAKQAAQC